MGLVKESQHEAFSELYHRYNQLLLLYAHKKLQDKGAAQDIIQDVFVAIWENREQLQINDSVKGYLYQAVRNKALNVFARQKVSDKYLESLGNFLDRSPGETDYHIREQDILQTIGQEIALMPPQMRLVFELSRYHYLSHREIAAKLGISEDTVRKHIQRSLKRLKGKFGLRILLLFAGF